jgi:phosphoethanolamine N-methyltransferase
MRLGRLRNPFLRPRPSLAEAPPSPAPDSPGEAAAPEPTPPVRWTQARIAVADELWGDGFLLPGGEEEVLRLAAPLGLSEASSLLMLGVGAGGAARVVVNELGVWISGHETDPALVAVAAWRLPRAGAAVAKRASVAHWDPESGRFRHRAFSHAMALETLRGAPGRPVAPGQLLLALAGALRPHGHLVLVDVIATPRLDRGDPALAAWAAAEGRTAVPPTAAALTAALAELGFDVRLTEDISARHMRLAVQGWKRLVRELALHRPVPSRAAAVVAEAEVWLRRLRLMHAGQLRLVRWDAVAR